MTGPSALRAPESLAVTPGTEFRRPGHGQVQARARPQVDGKFFYVGGEKLYLRGVTYGTFAPHGPSDDGYDPMVAEQDFSAMKGHGINAVRLYSIPPRWLLDIAHQHGLWVLAGVPWEQHVTFLDSRETRAAIETRVRDGMRACAGHPALLAVAVGNEIPAQIVRWHGAAAVERFLARLCRIAREEDPDALITYVNYPSTEYLRLPAVDFLAYNVYLEDAVHFDAYFARLQNLAGDKPLVIAEIGLDSRRNGFERQASLVASEVRSTFERGGAGCFVFAWTDEWVRAGLDVRDWNFGLTTRQREPKPALAAVASAYRGVPFAENREWPSISVVLCSYNGERVIGECLDGLARLDYPDYEVIVVDDGSTDRTPEIAARYPVRVVRTPNRGLSAARNEGLAAARGDIVAYIDDDAVPDRDWLRYLGGAFATSDHAGIGGPNVPPRARSWLEGLLARAPGGPIHVLRTDEEAEHIPGCNSAYRAEALRAIGGFDPAFRIAGDDVDLCWRLHERGWTLGFAPGAMVWHRRRATLRSYLRQQRGYGRAEALLERKWPSRFNALGHVAWPGQLYGDSVDPLSSWPNPRRFHGTWGSAEFQSLYQPGVALAAPTLMPEWYLGLALLVGVSLLGAVWPPLLLAIPLLALAASATLLLAVLNARNAARRPPLPGSDGAGVALLGALYVLQPVARLYGRVQYGLTPWRRHGRARLALPTPRRLTVWSEQWQSLQARLHIFEDRLGAAGVPVRRGGEFDTWDLEVRGGAFGSARLLGACEEHGGGRQLVRFRAWPRVPHASLVVTIALSTAAVTAFSSAQPAVAVVFLMTLSFIVARVGVDTAGAMASLLQVVHK